MVFRIASSPYTHNQRQTSRIMLLVLIAALPGIAAQTWFLVGERFSRSFWLLSRRSSQKPLSSGCANNRSPVTCRIIPRY